MSLHNRAGGLKKVGWRGRENSEGTLMSLFLIRTLILSVQRLTIMILNPDYLQKGPTPNTVILQEHQYIYLGGGKCRYSAQNSVSLSTKSTEEGDSNTDPEYRKNIFLDMQ